MLNISPRRSTKSIWKETSVADGKSRLPASHHLLPSKLPSSCCEAMPPSTGSQLETCLQPQHPSYICIPSLLHRPRCSVPVGFQPSAFRRPPPAASGAHTHAGCSGVGTMANAFTWLLHLTKPPLSWKKVSSTDNMLNDNSFSFCRRELLNISFLSPAHFRAALTGQEGLPGEWLERLEPLTSLDAAAAPPGSGLSPRWCLNAAPCWTPAFRRRPGTETHARRGETALGPVSLYKSRTTEIHCL